MVTADPMMPAGNRPRCRNNYHRSGLMHFVGDHCTSYGTSHNILCRSCTAQQRHSTKHTQGQFEFSICHKVSKNHRLGNLHRAWTSCRLLEHKSNIREVLQSTWPEINLSLCASALTHNGSVRLQSFGPRPAIGSSINHSWLLYKHRRLLYNNLLIVASNSVAHYTAQDQRSHPIAVAAMMVIVMMPMMAMRSTMLGHSRHSGQGQDCDC